MLSAYLEPSFINRALDARRTGSDLLAVFRERALRPIVGLHAIYETSRTLLKPGQEVRAHELFGLLRALEPTYYWFPDYILRRELEKLRYGAAVLPFLDHDNHIRAVREVNKLADGVLTPEGRAFIQGREADIAANFPSSSDLYIEHIEGIRSANPELLPKGRQFDDVVRYFQPQFPRFVAALLPIHATAAECRSLSLRLDEFPCLRATLRANLYMCFIMVVHGVKPGKDKLDDYRHVVEAAYCDVILTADDQLESTAPRITPGLRVIPFRDLWATNAAA